MYLEAPTIVPYARILQLPPCAPLGVHIWRLRRVSCRDQGGCSPSHISFCLGSPAALPQLDGCGDSSLEVTPPPPILL